MRKFEGDAPALLLAAAGLLALVHFGQLPHTGRWAAALSNAAHAPTFALLTLILLAMIRRSAKQPAHALRDHALAIGIALLLGATIELLQRMTGRDASWDDLMRDGLGAVAASGFYAVIDPRVRALPASRAIQLTGFSIALLASLVALVPLAVTGAAYLQRHRSFPTLVDFGSPTSTYFLGVYSAAAAARAPLPAALLTDGRRTVALRARLEDGRGWGLALWEPRPDWTAYERLAIDLANPTDAPLRLQLHVRDYGQRNDRTSGYVATVEVGPRSRAVWTTPLQRLTEATGKARVDIGIVHSIVLTGQQGNDAREFYLARIWLE